MNDDLIKAIDDLRDTVHAHIAITLGEDVDFEFESTEPVDAINEITRALADCQ